MVVPSRPLPVRTSLVILALVLGACGGERAPTPPPADAPAPRDLPPATDVSPTADADGDGLCDLTERMRRTDPAMHDTDGDGLLDGFEVTLGSDPLSGRSPPATSRILLRESTESFATVEHTMEHVGAGEVLVGATLDRTPGVDGLRPSELLAFTVEAASAMPMAFVRAVSGPRFIGVLGRVALQWRLTARPRADVPARVNLGCRRAYETQLAIKREGDDIEQVRPYVVELAPPEGTTRRPTWPRVSADGLCLPSRCF